MGTRGLVVYHRSGCTLTQKKPKKPKKSQMAMKNNSGGEGMTQEKWDRLSDAQKVALLDAALGDALEEVGGLQGLKAKLKGMLDEDPNLAANVLGIEIFERPRVLGAEPDEEVVTNEGWTRLTSGGYFNREDV